MDSAMTAGEITLALAVILVLLALAAMVLRTRAIGRDGNLAVMAVRYPGWCGTATIVSSGSRSAR